MSMDKRNVTQIIDQINQMRRVVDEHPDGVLAWLRRPASEIFDELDMDNDERNQATLRAVRRAFQIILDARAPTARRPVPVLDDRAFLSSVGIAFESDSHPPRQQRRSRQADRSSGSKPDPQHSILGAEKLANRIRQMASNIERNDAEMWKALQSETVAFTFIPGGGSFHPNYRALLRHTTLAPDFTSLPKPGDVLWFIRARDKNETLVATPSVNVFGVVVRIVSTGGVHFRIRKGGNHFYRISARAMNRGDYRPVAIVRAASCGLDQLIGE